MYFPVCMLSGEYAVVTKDAEKEALISTVWVPVAT